MTLQFLALGSFVGLSVVIGCSAAPQNVWHPPSIGPEELPSATVKAELVGSLRIGDMPVVLEATSLEQVSRRLGGVLGHSGDAGASLDWLCTHGIDREGAWVLWLLRGEIHGDTVGGFQMRRIGRNDRLDRRCVKADRIELPIPLKLGLSDQQIETLLGAPSERTGDIARYVHEHDESAPSGPFTSVNTVSITFRRGVVNAFQVWKATAL